MNKKKVTDIYKKMDEVNENIQQLFLEYLRLSKELLEAKQDSGLPISDNEQETLIRESIKNDKDILIRKYYLPVNEALLNASNSIQKDLINSPVIYENTIRIAYFGMGVSNTYLSLVKMLEKDGFRFINQYSLFKDQMEIELVETKSISDLEHKLVVGEVDYAFVPYVNSNTGVVIDTYHLMRNVRFKFESIFVDKIVLYLYIAKRNAKKIKDFYDIETIYSNIPALNQCSDFVINYTPFATYRKASSTTQSIDMMLEDKDHLAACFANISADSNDKILRYQDKTTSNNNGTYTKYLLISLPKNNSLMKKQNDIKDYFVGYYLYTSERKEGKVHSVDAKSYRAVEVLKDSNGELQMFIYTFGNQTKKISHSTKVEVYVDDITKDIVLAYHYIGETVNSTVCGDAYLRAKEHVLCDPNRRIHGEYNGANNGKSGTLEYRRISKKEFELLTEVTY